MAKKKLQRLKPFHPECVEGIGDTPLGTSLF
jgi:hypothetical protein